MAYINEVFESGHYAGNGPFAKRVQQWLENHFSAPRVLLTHSCTAALEIAGLLLDLGPEDEVIVPSYTFVTSASSFMRTGARPVFCEIEPETMLLDIDDVERRISSRTKVIVPVHYAGYAADMSRLLEISDTHDLTIVEDNAQGLGASLAGKRLGTFGALSAVSFHETKNIHCGLGGCLVVNDPQLAERAENIWERGTNRSAFFKGLVDKYSWVELGSSFYPSELQAAFLLAQLESMDENLEHRRMIWDAYEDALGVVESEGHLRILRPPEDLEHNAHMFAILLPDPQRADELRLNLNAEGIQAVIHYVPLHSSSMGQQLGWRDEDLPLTRDGATRLLRLPLHHGITPEHIDAIATSINEWCRS